MDIKYWIWLAILILSGAVFTFITIYKDYQQNNKFTILSGIIIILVVFVAIAEYKKSRLEFISQKKDKTEVIDAIKSTHDLIGIKSFPGYTITVVVRLEDTGIKKRKYIFDIGLDPNTNRISLYLDNENNLVYRLIDKEGEHHTIKIPRKIHTFQLNTFYYIHCEYGDTDDFNYMRLSINDKSYDPIKFKHKVNLPENIYGKNFFMFTDIEKQDFGKLTIAASWVSKSTFTDSERLGIMEIFSETWNKIGN